MGQIILCVGNKSDTPYYFKSTGIGIYTFEELCYYVSHYIENLGDEMLDPALARFVGDKLGMKECAQKLERLADVRAGVRDVIIAILGCSPFHTEKELAQIISDFDTLNNMTSLQRKKRKADKSLEAGRNREAMHLYKDILYSADKSEIDSAEYGNILHNIAIVHARSGAFATAADEFREAYARNDDERTLKQYIYALKLGHLEDEFQRELQTISETRHGLYEAIQSELYYATDNEENTYDYHEYTKLKELREKGKVAEYYKLADEMVTHLKNKYRAENG